MPRSGGRNEAAFPERTPLAITQEKLTRQRHAVAGEKATSNKYVPHATQWRAK